MTIKKITLCAYVLFLALSAKNLSASENESTLAPQNESQAYSFFEIGAVARAYTPLFNSRDTFETDSQPLTLRFGIKWDNGIFMNFGNFGTRGNGVGYNFYDYGDWEFDAIVHLGLSGIEIGRTASVADFRFGLRATHYSDNGVFRMIASPVSINSDDDGFYLGSWYVKNWQIRNWNIHAITGASYFSADIMDNRYSTFFFIPERPEFPNYKAGQGVVLEFEVGASYALNRDWVFEASLGQTLVSDAIFDSPFVDKRGQTYASVGIMYVF
ncbi:MipA/OmpV family protein [Glaciecola sp. SC05]|uniref:MipA/OmpV family protein n=1 Tax=Glaciecola sp. SC05 TaxID=1987355 RepID=UPI003527C626